jgi:hypothetical protein
MRGTRGLVVTSCVAVALLAGCGASSPAHDAAAPTSPAPRTSSPQAAAVAATFDPGIVCTPWGSARTLEKQVDAVAQRSEDYQNAAQQKFDTDLATVIGGIAQAPVNVRTAAAELRADVSFHPSESSDQAKAARIAADMTAVDDYVTEGCPNE